MADKDPYENQYDNREEYTVLALKKAVLEK
jgi:hypothetical protein